MKRMKFFTVSIALVFTLFALKLSLAELSTDFILKEAKESLKKIDFVLTNTGYSRSIAVDMDSFYETLKKHGVSISNVHYIHSNEDAPLFFAFCNKDTNDLFYADSTGKKVKENVGFQTIVSNSHEWDKKIKGRIFSGFEFSIITIAHMISAGAPSGLLKAAEFHNHVCPGLWTGYFISRSIKKEMKKDDNLIIFAVPPFCKDDFFQVVFDVTPGKKSMFVRDMRDEEKRLYPDLAGIYVFWNRKKDAGRALVLGFDTESMKKEAKINENEYPWLWRYKLNDWIIKNISTSEKFLRVIKDTPIDKKKLERLMAMETTLTDL